MNISTKLQCLYVKHFSVILLAIQSTVRTRKQQKLSKTTASWDFLAEFWVFSLIPNTENYKLSFDRTVDELLN